MSWRIKFFVKKVTDTQEIAKVRQKIVRLMRLIGPKRVLLRDLSEQISGFAGHDMSKIYSTNTKAANRLWEVIEEAKETVEIYKDADFTANTERTNETLAVLTIIFTLTIPVTVVGTIYGMNIKLPGGLVAGSWTFLGEYTSLIVLFSFSALLALMMYIYFKTRKWF
jgi:magnesium transporter